MTLLEKTIDFFGGERKIKTPIFVKEFSDTNQQLKELNQLSQQLKNGPKKEIILRDIMFLKQGIEGERNVYYELKTSFVPSLCLHDIRLDYDGHIAQFDFIIITPRFVCVLETKKLSGNITINSDGDFIRTILDKYGRDIRHEGIYSPISQNERHIKILKDILVKEKLLGAMPYRSLVVMANPKTIINKEKCPERIQQSLVRHDQIVNYLENLTKELTNEKYLMEKYMWDVANYLKENDKPLTINYLDKYNLSEADFIKDLSTSAPLKPQETKQRINNTDKRKDSEILVKELKEFRLTTSRKENIKPYFIFDNKQMEDLIAKYPKNKEQLLAINGIGPKKLEKYGDEILRILNT